MIARFPGKCCAISALSAIRSVQVVPAGTTVLSPWLVPAVEMCEESEVSEVSLGTATRMDRVSSGYSAEAAE
jgi:hypothetical protein